MTRNLWIPLLLCGLVFSSGCENNTSGRGERGAGVVAAPTGGLALLVGNQPVEGYSSLLGSIVEIALIPGDGSPPVVVFVSDGVEVDLLAFRDEDFLLSIVDSVPVGVYAGVSLTLSDLRAAEGPCDEVRLELPAVELEMFPETAIEVTPGTVSPLRVVLDVDRTIRPGAEDRCTLLPLLEVESASIPGPARHCLQRVTGVLVGAPTDESLQLDLGHARGTVNVNLLGAGLFDEDGIPVSASALTSGARATAFGELSDGGEIEARIVVAGEITRLAGVIRSATAEPGVDYLLEPASGTGGTGVVVSPDTAILHGCEELTVSALQSPGEVVVFGCPDGSSEGLRAILVILGSEIYDGTITSVEDMPDGMELVVEETGGDENAGDEDTGDESEGDDSDDGDSTGEPGDGDDPIIVFIPDDVGVDLEGAGEVPPYILTEVVECGGLEIHLELDPIDETLAISATVEADVIDGTIDTIQASESFLTIDGQEVLLVDGATVLDLRDGQQLVPVEDLAVGDDVRIFGLEGCPDPDGDEDIAAFYGFVLLVFPPEVDGPPSETDCCVDGKPRVLTLRYTGDSCEATDHSQDSHRVSCEGDPDFAETVHVIANDKNTPTEGRVWFEGDVDLNQEFELDSENASRTKLGSKTFLHLFDLDENLLQSVEFHTSCSQPLVIGDVFGSVEVVSCIGEDVPVPGSCCSDGTPQALSLRYSGDDCEVTTHSQDESKVSCEGDPEFADTVYVVASDSDTASAGLIWFAGEVTLHETFVIDASNDGEDKLKARTYLHIFSEQDGDILQELEFHTSCSQPLGIGNRFGSVTVLGCTSRDGVTAFAEGCDAPYWSGNAGEWDATDYATGDSVEDVFVEAGAYPALASLSLLEALDADEIDGDTPSLAEAAGLLLESAVAAILNASHGEVVFPRAVADVVASVDEALATEDVEALVDLVEQLDLDNALDCSLD